MPHMLMHAFRFNLDSDADLDHASPEVREIGERIKALMLSTRAERGERFCAMVEFLYAVAQLRMFIGTAPVDFAHIGDDLITQLAKSMDRLLPLSGDKDMDEAGAVAEQLVRMCLIRVGADGEPDRSH